MTEEEAILVPREHDVAIGMGRDGNIGNYPGNETFRALVRSHAPVQGPSRKREVAERIVQEIHHKQGRFLQRAEADDCYELVPNEQAMEKARGAMHGFPTLPTESIAHPTIELFPSDTISDLDIILEPDSDDEKHPGNVAFQVAVSSHRSVEPSCAAEALVDSVIKRGGRFIQRASENFYFVASTEVAYDRMRRELLTEAGSAGSDGTETTSDEESDMETEIESSSSTDEDTAAMNLLVLASCALAQGKVTAAPKHALVPLAPKIKAPLPPKINVALQPKINASMLPKIKSGISRTDIMASDISERDVLLGRGKGADLHPGNISYRTIVMAHRDAYLNASSLMKRKIAQQVVEKVIRKGGRFVQREKDNVHNVVSKDAAVVKTCQALREKKSIPQPKEKKAITQAKERNPSTSGNPRPKPFPMETISDVDITHKQEDVVETQPATIEAREDRVHVDMDFTVSTNFPPKSVMPKLILPKVILPKSPPKSTTPRTLPIGRGLLATDVTDLDVLVGRGKRVDLHPGNISFRVLVQSQREIYVQLENNRKRPFAEQIVNHIINRGGRFIQQDCDNVHRVICMATAIEKTCQALREKEKSLPHKAAAAAATAATTAITVPKKKPQPKLEEKTKEKLKPVVLIGQRRQTPDNDNGRLRRMTRPPQKLRDETMTV